MAPEGAQAGISPVLVPVDVIVIVRHRQEVGTVANRSTTPVALVTGASRGIGKAIAIELASAGYDVAILARTVHEGEAREHSSTLKRSDTSPLPGSLDGTAALVRAAGRACLAVQADLLDHPSLVHAVATVLEQWGRVDVLVNNGRYIGPGHMDHIIDTPVRVLRDHLEANALAPVVLVKEVVPGMIERGGGTIIDITSTVAYEDPAEPAGQGGWGLGYAFSKGALHRIAGILAVELRDDNVLAYNVQPGFIATERMLQDMGAFGFDASAGAPVEVVGKACRWLLESPEAPALNGRCIHAQELCHERGLLPGWSLDR
jgi:NAD(P)-dependent dehydrogenase (short-subunit alcohol dehydrogenase family)